MPRAQASGDGVTAPCAARAVRPAPRIDGDGSQSRDFTYVKDVARGVTMALEAETSGCQTVNLACAGNHSVLSLFEILRRQAGVDVEPVHGPSRTGDVMLLEKDHPKNAMYCPGCTRDDQANRVQPRSSVIIPGMTA